MGGAIKVVRNFTEAFVVDAKTKKENVNAIDD
jgi:hypothetical protein